MFQALQKLLGVRVVRLDEIPPLEIATPRLRLRSFRVFDDWPRYREYQRDPEVMRHVSPREPSDEKLRAGLKAFAALTHFTPGHVYLGIQLADDARLLGEIQLVADRLLPSRAFLGFVLHRDAWGRGIATEAARAMIDHAFRVLPFQEVWAGCARENAQSRRVLEKVGLLPTEEKATFPGEPAGADTLVFRTDRATWVGGGP